MRGGLREIGGYLELEDFGGVPYHAGSLALDSARSCLGYLAELRGIAAIALPDLMCDAVSSTCSRMGVEHRTYRVGEDLLPVYDFELGPGEWLYLADYYGTLTAEAVERACEFSSGRLVVDEVQGFFREPWAAADTFYTCRKFFGVPDGAYLATRDGARLVRELPACRSASRMGHVLGRCEDGASVHYADYALSEDRVGSNGPEAMSEITRRLLSGVNYDRVRKVREGNFAVLERMLGPTNLINIDSPVGPYAYPYLAPGSGASRGALASRGVYIPTLWPNVVSGQFGGSVARNFASEVLPLPVDQRYNVEDMEYLAAVVLETVNLQKGMQR